MRALSRKNPRNLIRSSLATRSESRESGRGTVLKVRRNADAENHL